MDNGFKVQFFGGYHGKALGKVEPHLIAKNTQGPCSGAVPFLVAVLQYVFQKVVVLFHAVCSVTMSFRVVFRERKMVSRNLFRLNLGHLDAPLISLRAIALM